MSANPAGFSRFSPSSGKARPDARALRRRARRKQQLGRTASPERLEERRVLSASVAAATELLDLDARAAYLAAGRMGPEPAQSVFSTTAADYDRVDSRWFWSLAEPAPARALGVLADAAPEEWLVRLSAESINGLSSAADLQAFLDPGGHGLEVVAGLGLPGLLLVRADAATIDVATLLDGHSGVAYFEPNRDVAVGSTIPDDPRFGELFGLHNLGQSGGLVDADIDAVEAWQSTTGSRNVVVGVIDTGIDMAHPDLYRNIWMNQAEIPAALRVALQDVDGDSRITFIDINAPANAGLASDRNGNGFIDPLDILADARWADGQDTDGNSFRDDLFGWDFVNNDNNPSDDHRHGTHVAGTIGATGNDGVGVVGVSWEVSLMGLKFLSGSGSGSTANAIRSVNYATMMRLQGDDGIRVTNNSWGGGGYSQALKEAIDAGGRSEILFVAAAGNSNTNVDRSPHYPAGYASPAIVAVAATDRNDNRSSFSNYGQGTVHLGAPGSGILSTVPGGGYAFLSGTSMAAPHVAGAAALAAAANPDLSIAELKQAVLATADPIAALSGLTVSGGRLNAATLVESVGVPAADIVLQGDTVAENSAVGTLVGVLSATLRNSAGFAFSLEPGMADNALFSIEGTDLRTAEVLDFEAQQTLTVRVRATDSAGVVTAKNFTIQVTDQPESPTVVRLTGGRVARAAPVGTAVGTLTTDDPDLGDPISYELVTGEGGDDNEVFVIDGAILRTAQTIDFGDRAGFFVRVRATDSTGNSVEASFAIAEFVTDRYGFDRLVVEAFQAGSTLDLEDLRVVDLATGQLVYANSFDDGQGGGLTLTHWADRGAEPRFDGTKTRVVDGRLRLESTGFGRNGSGGYDSRSRATLQMQLPEDFEISFTLFKHQWAGHVAIHITPDALGSPEWLPQLLGGVGGFATNIQGGQINFANVLGIDESTRNLLDPPGYGTSGPYLRTDVRYRIVKQAGTLRLYVQDQLRASTDALTAVVPPDGAPTDIQITPGSIAENAPVGTPVGRLSTVDPDAGDAFTYQLVAGAGAEGNELFAIDGDTLVARGGFDFERQSEHRIRVRSTDQAGLWFEKELTISVTDVNEAPTGVVLGNPVGSIAENADTSRPIPLGDIVVSDDRLGENVIELAGEDAESFEVVSGGLFLKSGVTLDRAAKPRYTVVVTVRDATIEGSEPVSVQHVLEVTPAATSWSFGFRHVNEAGAEQHLIESVGMRKYSEWQSNPITYWGPSANGVEGRLVYRFDFPQDARDVRLRVSLPSWDYTRAPDNRYTGQGRGAWALEASSDGDTWVAIRNNLEPRNWGEKWSMDGLVPAEAVSGRSLFVRMRFLVENSPNSSYTNAQFGRSTAAAPANVFEIEASLSVNRRPTDILLAGGGIAENVAVGTLVGSLSTVDPDGDEAFTYALVSGDGDADNGLFALEGDRLVVAGSFDYEARSEVTIRVRSTDVGGLSVERSFRLPILDVNEPPTAILVEPLVENLPEDANTSEALRVANVLVFDDALGDNELAVSGPDANFFELRDGGLFLRAGVALDYETHPALSVVITAADPTIPEADPVSVGYALTIDDVAEPVIVISNAEVNENLPSNTIVGSFSRSDERAERTPLNLFYSPEDGRLWLSNTTSEPLAIQSVTVTSPGQKLSGDEALMPDVPFRSSNHSETAPFGLHSEIFFATFGAAAITLAGGEAWDFGFVADVGLSSSDIQEFFATDPAIDDGEGDRSGRFLYTLFETDMTDARVRGRISSTASQYTYELVAGAGDADNSLFTLDGTTLRTAASFDYEARNTYSIRVRSHGEGGSALEEVVTITIGDVNEAPTGVRIGEPVVALPEDADTTGRVPLATIIIDDDALGVNELVIEGEEAEFFELEGNTLFLRAGVVLDFETQAAFSITLRAADPDLPASQPVGVDYSLAILDVNEPPRAVSLTNTTERLFEDTSAPRGERVKVAEIVIDDDAIGINEIGLSGADAEAFEVEENVLYLKAGTSLDYETQPVYDVTVVVTDASLPGSPSATADFRLRIDDRNESPTAVVLAAVVRALPESADTTAPIRVAEITVIDDALGANTLEVRGADAEYFEIRDGSLFLRAGVTLDYGVKDRYDVFVMVDDATAEDRLAKTPLSIVYDAASGRLRVINTTDAILAVQSVAIVSPERSISGAEAVVPEAQFTVLNTSDRGIYGRHSEIFFANVGASVMTLGEAGEWDLGPVAVAGLTAGRLQTAFATDPEVDPEHAAGPGRFLYSLIVDGEAGEPARGAIIGQVESAFTLAVTNDPGFSGREYIDVAEGEIWIDDTVRSDGRQLIKRGAGTLVLAAANSHTGGTRVEGGMLVARDTAAFGSGQLDILDHATVSLDVGTARVALGGLALTSLARIDVGFGGLRLAAGGVDPTILRQWLISGRGTGDWRGYGIASYAVAEAKGYAVGNRILADGSATVGWAAYGDSNVDGRINSSDINMIIGGAKFGRRATDAGWWQGDYNYDGRVNSQDLNMLLTTGLLHKPSYFARVQPGPGVGTVGIAARMALWASYGQESESGGN